MEYFFGFMILIVIFLIYKFGVALYRKKQDTEILNSMFNSPFFQDFMSHKKEEYEECEKLGIKPVSFLIPHDQIRLGVIIKAWQADLLKQIIIVQNMDISDFYKKEKISKMEREVEQMIFDFRRQPCEIVKEQFNRMSETRKDMKELEKIVREETGFGDKFSLDQI